MLFVDGANTANPKPFELTIPLSGKLAPKHATPLTVPESVVDTARNTTYSIVDLEYSSAYLEVHTRLGGELRNVITRSGTGDMSGEIYPGVFLVDRSGSYSIPVVVSGPGRAIITDTVQDETRIFGVTPGTYRVVVLKSEGSSTPGSSGDVILAQWTVTIS